MRRGGGGWRLVGFGGGLIPVLGDTSARCQADAARVLRRTAHSRTRQLWVLAVLLWLQSARARAGGFTANFDAMEGDDAVWISVARVGRC